MSMNDRRIYLWGKYLGDKHGEWEHLDTADEHNTKDFLMQNYRMAFGSDWLFVWKDTAE